MNLVDKFKVYLMTRSYRFVPAPLWALVVSPLLWWAGIRGPKGVFTWPVGRSRNPLNRSFWWV